jgi:hypothetical protein
MVNYFHPVSRSFSYTTLVPPNPQPRTAYGGTPTASGRKKSSKENASISALEQHPRKKARTSDALRMGKENGGSEASTEADLLNRVLALLQQPAAAAALGSAAPVTTEAAAAEAAAAQAARAEAAFWKGQYEALRELRETAPEQRLRELRASVDNEVWWRSLAGPFVCFHRSRI